MSTRLGAMSVGSAVMLNVNGTAKEFLVVHQGLPSSIYDSSCNGTWLLMKDIYGTGMINGSQRQYYQSTMHSTTLNKTFLGKLDSEIQDAIKQAKIPYSVLSGSVYSGESATDYQGADGLSAKIFLLAAREIGFSDTKAEDGACLDYFSGASASKRIAYDGGTASAWWLRTTATGSTCSIYYIKATGERDFTGCTTSLGVRPALILDSSLTVYDDGSVHTNTAPSTPSAIFVPSSIKGGSTITISWNPSSDIDGNLSGYSLERSTNGGTSWTQIYQGSNTSATNTVTKGTETVIYRVKAYDSEGENSGYRTSSQRTISNNEAPSTPSSINVPSSIQGGSTITISWGSSSDSDGNLAGYIVERSTNGGTSWTQIYQGGERSTTNAVAQGTSTVMYRVKAYDSEGASSGYRTSSQITVTNNVAPSAPPSITVPNNVRGGSSLVITWSASSDSDGNLSGYKLERAIDGGSSWTQIYQGEALTYTDTISKGWTSVQYRVRAYDPYTSSGYVVSPTRAVDNNNAPKVWLNLEGQDVPSGTVLGMSIRNSDADAERQFGIPYYVCDDDKDSVTITELLDGVVHKTMTLETLTEAEFNEMLEDNDPEIREKGFCMFLLTSEEVQKLSNGQHTMLVSVTDGKATSTYTLYFSKKVTFAEIKLKEAMPADDRISVCVLTITGDIPADAALEVKVTNNANDSNVVWEDCTAEAKNGLNHAFTNTTAANGFAFNFWIKVERGDSDVGGYIKSIQGGFQ